MKYTEFTRLNIQWTRKEMEAVFAAIEEEHGIKLSIGTMSFDTDRFTCRVEGVVIKSGMEGKSVREIKGKDDFLNNCFMYGMEKTDLGQTKVIKGVEYKLIGLNTRSKKYPLIIENKATGKNARANLNWWKKN